MIGEREDLMQEVLVRIESIISYQRRAFCSGHNQFRDISLPQMSVLIMLRERGPRTISELAELLQVSAPSASAILDRMEERGYVRRSRDSIDRRVVHVEVTEEGRGLIDEMAGVKRDRMQRLLSVMDEDDLRSVIAGIDALQRAFELEAP